MEMKTSIRHIKIYCGIVIVDSPATSTHSSLEEEGGHRTRSQQNKELFLLAVPECVSCNDWNLECFQEEYMKLLKKFPLS